MALASAKQARAHVGSGDPAGRPVSDFYQTPVEAVWALLSAERITGPIWEPACGAGAISRALQDGGYDVVSTDLYDAVYIVEEKRLHKVVGALTDRESAEECVRDAAHAEWMDGGCAKPLSEFIARYEITEMRYDFGASGIDFLASTPPSGIRSIVTNPPFALAEEFAERAAAIIRRTGGQVALMQRLAWLETPGRAELFARTGLSRVWVLSRRIPLMHRPGYTGEQARSSIPFAWFVWRADHVGEPTVGWVDWMDAAPHVGHCIGDSHQLSFSEVA